MVQFVHKLLLRFKYALKGISFAILNDPSFKIQFYTGAVFAGGFWYLMRPLSQEEALFLILAWTLVLITELQNTAFESALDRIHPEMHDDIGKSKDMAAGATLIAGFFALFVIITISLNRI